MIVMVFGLMIGIGASSIFSRAYGRSDKETMRKSVNTVNFMGIVLSIAITVLGIISLD